MKEKKHVVIACGKGMITANMVVSKVKDLLLKNDIEAEVNHVKVENLKDYEGKADLFISTVKVDPDEYETPTVMGSSLLVGFNEEEAEEEILNILRGNEDK